MRQGVNEATQTLGSLESSAKSIATNVAGYLTGALSVGAFAGKLIAVQREFDVLNSSLITVTGSSSAAAREFAWIKQFAAETPYGLNQVTEAFVKMKSLGLDASKEALQSYGNTASAMGKSLNQMIEAVADASTGEFERLKEFGIKARQQGDQVSLTFQGITKSIGNNAAEITKYLQEIGNNQFASAMAERAKTLDGAISNLGDTWDELFRTINQNNAGGLIFDSVKLASGAISDAIDILNAMNRATGENARQTGAAAAIQEGLAVTFETVAVLGTNLAYVLEGIGREIGGLAAQAVAAAQLDFSAAAEIGRLMKSDAEAARAAVDAQAEAIINARANASEYRQVLENAKKGTADYNATVGRLIEMQNAGKISAQDFRTAVESLQPAAKSAASATTAVAVATKGAGDAAKKAAQEAARLAGASEKTNAAWRDSITHEAQKITEAADKTTASLREQYETLGLTTAELANYRAAKLDTASAAEAHAAAELETASVLLDLQNQLPDVARSYRELASARRAASAQLSEQAQLTRASAEKQANIDAAQAAEENAAKAAQEWQRTADAIEDALIDALMEGGKSGKEYIEGLFRSMVLRPVVQAIVQPVAGSITSAMRFGAPEAGGAGGNLLSMASNLSSLSNLGSIGGSLGMMAGSFGAGTTMTATQLGNLANAGLVSPGAATAGWGAANLGPGLAAYGLGQKYGVLGGVAGGVGTSALVGGIGGLASGAGFMSGAGSALAGLGPAGWAAIAAGAILGSVMGNKKPSDKAAWATYDPTRDSVTHVGSMTGKKDPGQEARDQTAALAQLVGAFGDMTGITQQLRITTGARDGVRVAMDDWRTPTRTPGHDDQYGQGGVVGYGSDRASAIKAMLDDLVDEGTLPQATIDAWRSLKTDTLGAAREADELVGALGLLVAGYDAATIERANLLQTEGEALESALGRMQAIESALSGTALPGDAMAQSAAAMVKEFERLNQAVPLSAEALGQVISGLDLTTAEGRATYQSLMALAPAFLELQAAQESLYNSLLTDQQRLMLASGDLAGAFEHLGVAAPKSRAELLALIDGLDGTTSAGAKLKAQVLGLAPAFLEVEAGIQQMLSDVGINLGEFQTTLRDALLGRTDAVDAGHALATMVIDGVYNGIADTYAQQITDLVASQIITPVVQAAVTGASITEIVSKDAIDSIVATANAAAAALNAVLADPAFRGAMAQISGAISGITVGAAVRVPSRPYTPPPREPAAQQYVAPTVAAEADPLLELLNERRRLEIELLRAQGREMEAASLARAEATKGFHGAALAAYDFNRALERQIEATQRAAQVAAERDGLERQLLQVQGDTAGLRARDLAALDESNRALQQHIWAMQDQADAAAKAAQIERDRMAAADNALREAENNLRAAYNREAGELRQTITQLEGFTRSLRDLKRELMGGSLSPLGIFGRRDELSRQFADVAARAAAGDEQAMGELSGLTSQYLSVVQDSASSAEDYYRKFAAVRRTLDDTQSVAERELDATQAQLATLDRQVSALITINDSVLSVRDAINAFLTALTAQTIAASVSGYVSSQVSAASSYAASGGVLDSSAAKPSTVRESQIAKLYESNLGRVADAGGLAYYAKTDMSISQIASSLSASAEAAARAISKDAQNQFIEDVNKSLGLSTTIKAFASGGYHVGGLRLVGEQGPELEVTGPARIYSADQTRAMLGGSNEEMVRELRALRAELAELKAASAATARSTSDTARIMTRVTNGGNAMLTETAA
jgi:hypothetical protein